MEPATGVSQARRFRGRAAAARMAPTVLGGAVLSGFVAALWMRFNAAPGLTGESFPRDFLYYYLPMTELAASRLRAGELPSWNPYHCSGIPLLATLQVGAFYPGSWLAVPLGAAHALPLRALGELAVCALGSALWFRELGHGFAAVLLGAMLVVFSCALPQVFWPPMLSSLAWLPLLLFATERLVARGSLGAWVLLCAVAALQILAGFPQVLVYSYYLLVPYAAVRLVETQAPARLQLRRLVRRGAGLAAAIAVALGIAAAQLLPTLELIDESPRSGGLSDEEINYEQLSWEPLPLVGVLKNTLDPAPKLMSFDYGYGAGYLGLATLFALGLGIAAHARRPTTWLFVILGVGSLLLSEGSRGALPWLWDAYTALPGGDTFRVPARLRLITLVSAIGLAVAGFSAWTRGFPAWRGRPAMRGLVLGIATAAAFGMGVFGAAGAAPRAAAALALLAAALLAGRQRTVRRACAALLTGLVAVDLWLATGPDLGSFRRVPVDWVRSLHRFSHTFVSPEEYAELRDGAALGRLAIPNLDPPMGLAPLTGAYRISCLEPLAPRQWRRLHELLTGLPPAYETLGLLGTGPGIEAFYDIAGVSAVLRGERDEAQARARRQRLAGDRSDPRRAPGPSPDRPAWMKRRIAANGDPLPRSYVVEGFELATQEEALSRVARADFEFRRRVLLEQEPGLPPVSDPPPARPARIVEYAPERAEVECEARRESLLVLSDTFYPGWRAEVDGREAPILRANGLYRAVRIPPGSHRVSFRYEPSRLRLGIGVSLASLGLVAAASARAAARRRRRSEARPSRRSGGRTPPASGGGRRLDPQERSEHGRPLDLQGSG